MKPKPYSGLDKNSGFEKYRSEDEENYKFDMNNDGNDDDIIDV